MKIPFLTLLPLILTLRALILKIKIVCKSEELKLYFPIPGNSQKTETRNVDGGSLQFILIYLTKWNLPWLTCISGNKWHKVDPKIHFPIKPNKIIQQLKFYQRLPVKAEYGVTGRVRHMMMSETAMLTRYILVFTHSWLDLNNNDQISVLGLSLLPNSWYYHENIS